MAALETKFIGKLAGKVALVTGASRGIGKGIAEMLAQAGATVYITGRTLTASEGVKGSLSFTAEEIRKSGGTCIPIQCDHADDADVKELFETISKEQDGRLDILVNNAFAGVTFMLKYGRKPFYDMPLETWDIINRVGLRSNYICAYYAANLMIPRKTGLIVNMSSLGGLRHIFNTAYGVGKEANDRMAVDMAIEIKKHNVAVISLWPGPVKTEQLKDTIDKGMMDNIFRDPEDPTFAGKAVVALAADENVMKKSGRIHMTAELGQEYGFTDIGGYSHLSYRQIKKHVAQRAPQFSWMVPSFLYIPKWMFYLLGQKL